MIAPLLLKCATLILVIHGLRFLARRAGPRASGLVLGLPSSTAVLLVLCGRERGIAPAVEMADAGLLGLIAAVSLPLAFAHAVRRGWNLPAALATSVGAYVAVATGLELIHPAGSFRRLAICGGAILIASHLAARIRLPASAPRPTGASRGWTAAVRILIPSAYVLIVGLVNLVGGPRGAGLVSTFPSMSTVVLAVTHLEAGAAAAGRVARVLPSANLSTVAFLAGFRFGCPGVGLAGGTVVGYLAALLVLAVIEGFSRWLAPLRLSARRAAGARRLGDAPRRARAVGSGPRIPARIAAHDLARIRAPHRRPFAPRVEVLLC